MFGTFLQGLIDSVGNAITYLLHPEDPAEVLKLLVILGGIGLVIWMILDP